MLSPGGIYEVDMQAQNPGGGSRSTQKEAMLVPSHASKGVLSLRDNTQNWKTTPRLSLVTPTMFSVHLGELVSHLLDRKARLGVALEEGLWDRWIVRTMSQLREGAEGGRLRPQKVRGEGDTE